MKKEELIKEDQIQKQVNKIGDILQDRIIVLENENKDLTKFLNLMLTYQNISIEQFKDFEKNIEKYLKVSILINTNELANTMFKFLPQNYQRKTPQLLYRASKDGFSTKDFHDQTDNKGPLFFVMKSKDGKLFGGFCPDDNPFGGNNNYNVTKILDKSQGPFIFNLNDKIKCPLTSNKQKHTYYGGQEYGPTMGGNFDIYIYGDESKQFYLKVGYSYDNNGMENIELSTYQDYEVFGF